MSQEEYIIIVSNLNIKKGEPIIITFYNKTMKRTIKKIMPLKNNTTKIVFEPIFNKE